MIDKIILAEFDINLGSIITLEHPSKSGIKEIILSSLLIPEGMHNIIKDNFCCILRPKPEESKENFYENLKKINENVRKDKVIYLDLSKNKEIKERKEYKIKEYLVYDYISKKWNSQLSSKEKNYIVMLIEKNEEGGYFNIRLVDERKTIINIPIHSEIQFKKLEKSFFSIFNLEHQAIGLCLLNENDLVEIEQMLSTTDVIDLVSTRKEYSSKKDYLKNEIAIYENNHFLYSNPNDLYCFVHANTIKDKKIERGASMKSIAICTKSMINLHSFEGLAVYLLAEVFKISLSSKEEIRKKEEIRILIENAYVSYNKMILSYSNESFIWNSLLCHVNCNTYIYKTDKDNKNSFTYQVKDSDGKEKILSCQIKSYLNPEQIYSSCIRNFIKLFKENTMLIVDSVLLDKKIIFVGDINTTCDKLSKFQFSLIGLLGGQYSLIRKFNCVKTLYDLDFVKEEGCIYCITNPIMKDKKGNWDLLCDVETGKVVMSEDFSKEYTSLNRESEKGFINEILLKMNNEGMTDYEIEMYFRYYMNYMKNIYTDYIYIDDDVLINDTNLQWQKKLKLKQSLFLKMKFQMMSLNEEIKFNSISINQVEVYLNSINYRKILEKEELIAILKNIKLFLLEGNKAVEVFTKILYDISFDLIGKLQNLIFAKNDDVQVFAYEILCLLKKNFYSEKLIFDRGNIYFLLRFNNFPVGKEIEIK